MRNLKQILVAAVVALVALAGGAYAGSQLAERGSVVREVDDALTRTALNLQVIKRVREGKNQEAVALLNAMNKTNVAVLMRYDSLKASDPEFGRRRKTVAQALLHEWPDLTKEGLAKEGDPETAQFAREIRAYLERAQ